ncbi:MAG: S8 family serine peptidase [Lewinellaceae bacterium]|nr:S8 family serine peptidase [Lewinellaceae bacterium]
MKRVMFGFLILLLSVPGWIGAQSSMKAPENWFNLDWKKDGVPGVSTERSYETILKNKSAEPVIVAVIDGGVDPLHEDLNDVMWINPGEIADNGIDDDQNGYIDDIFGWNFIGNPNGESVGADALEVTRLYAHYDKKFKNANPATLKGKERKEYDYYKKLEETVTESLEKAKKNLDYYTELKSTFIASEDKLKKHLKTDELTLEQLQGIQTEDEEIINAISVVSKLLENGLDASYFDNVLGYFEGQTKYYDPTFDPRSIVGDNYADSREWQYGNNDVKGPEAFHGTHVAGIIGAERDNDLGIKGVSDQVFIMGVRVVPDGDERDKDVANGIRYAVDNGASVINMSFGKSYKWDKKVVDDAVKYAEKHDVLLVHAAGNDGSNTDIADNFPTDSYERSGWFGKKRAKNWIEVGALNWQEGDKLAAPFSNYGKDNVDLFAPGMAIHSTTPDNGYQDAQGTSMASPVVAGVAALVRAYYPDLTAVQVKDILMKSVVPVNQQVMKPGTKEMVPFSQLSVSGGVVNVYNALELAAKTKGKKSKNAKWRSASSQARVAKEKRDRV